MKLKYYLPILLLLSVLFVSFWNIVSNGYDKQNKYILFLKKIIPTQVSRKIRDMVFIIPDLKTRNKFLSLQVKKYEQGLDGQLFEEKVLQGKDKKYYLKNFFLPFPRLDFRQGWAATENSKRAHYLEIVGDKVILISGLGQTIFFNKKNILNKKLDQYEILNNIKSEILQKNNFELIGIRDLFVEKDKVYISLQFKNEKGFSINLYRANLNYSKLNFELFFETHEYWPIYNVYSGGRIEKFKNNKILFSIGYSYVKGAAQDKNSLLGKIISIDTNSGKHELISLGHRNQQGLIFVDASDLIINSEHGPMGGDEINFNFLKEEQLPNFGWDISSYGIEYDGTDPYKRSHKDYGFKEPFKYYVPSIGISEIIYLNKSISPAKKNILFISSLRAGSLYELELDKDLTKVLSENRIYFGNERIRDIEYDQENNAIFILFEYTPSIAVLKL